MSDHHFGQFKRVRLKMIFGSNNICHLAIDVPILLKEYPTFLVIGTV